MRENFSCIGCGRCKKERKKEKKRKTGGRKEGNEAQFTPAAAYVCVHLQLFSHDLCKFVSCSFSFQKKGFLSCLTKIKTTAVPMWEMKAFLKFFRITQFWKQYKKSKSFLNNKKLKKKNAPLLPPAATAHTPLDFAPPPKFLHCCLITPSVPQVKGQRSVDWRFMASSPSTQFN